MDVKSQALLVEELNDSMPTGPVETKVYQFLKSISKLSAVNEARAAVAISLAKKLDWDLGNSAAPIAKELSVVLSKIDETSSDAEDIVGSITGNAKMGNTPKP